MVIITKDDPIEKLSISNRTYNCLKRNNINTIHDLLNYPKNQFIEMRNLGKKSLDELEQLISDINNGITYVFAEGIKDQPPLETPKQTTDEVIEKIGLSTRAYNRLKIMGIDTVLQMIELTEKDLESVHAMGKKTIEEILEKIKEIESATKQALDNKSDIPIEFLLLAKECSDTFNLFETKIRNIISSIYYDNNGIGIESMVYLLYLDSYIRTACKDKIISICHKTGGESEISGIKEKLPEHLTNTTVIEDVLIELENAKRIHYKNGFCNIIYPTVFDFIAEIKDERKKEILLKRLNGQTLEEVGSEYNLTRERVRQICSKAFVNKKRLAEDQFVYLYKEYDLSEDDFCAITGEPTSTYQYLEIVCPYKLRRKTNPEEIVNDNRVKLGIRRKAETRIVYRNYVFIDGVWVKKNRTDLLKYIMSVYFREQTNSDDILEFYKNFLIENNLDTASTFIDNRTFENKMQASDYILYSLKRKMRYYNITDIDFTDFLNEINLEQYKDTELSSLMLYREHWELMAEYDIQDEYELHSLLRKIWPQSERGQVIFSKMPTICVGNSSRDMQVLDILIKYAPISQVDLAEKYEEIYGFHAQTAYNFFKCIDDYFHNGIYTIDSESFTPDERNRISEQLTDDFYSIESFTEKVLSVIPEASQSLINAYNIKSLGFHLNNGYIIRKTYSSAANYFNTILTNKPIVDAREFPPALLRVGAYSSEKYSLMNQRIITEFAPHQYINISRLNEVGVTIADLNDYCQSVRNFVKDDRFFTIQSIRQEGFYHKLDELAFEDWFYSSIIVEDKEHICSLRYSGNRILRFGKSQFNLNDFVEWIILHEIKIEIYDLLDLLLEKYNIKSEKYRIINAAKEKNLYYDEIMETIYIDYDTYFEEIWLQ